MKFKNNKVYKFPIFNWASRAFNDFPKNCRNMSCLTNFDPFTLNKTSRQNDSISFYWPPYYVRSKL